ncbi:putative RDD family membrane protein YckC [Knoellia remsis]|uniref:Putative RDD family membrane protein YckC n=1 Tax=Knoellia remsis TaxID=407159 RepID=A0A2T0UJE7_9MICO|nr:RDD family protein [Knoellia remsis]PRY58004.1 putative RDD family membrane protein YckC [Knoellia remsis]
MSETHDPNQQTPAQNPQNPYGAPPVAAPYGGGPAYPGSKAYVEQHFGPVADFGSRAGALIIDSLLSLIGLIPFLIGVVLLVVSIPETDSYGSTIDGTGNAGLAATGGILMGLGFLLGVAIMIWNRIFRMGRTGQSIGKKVMGLKLIGEQTGQPIGALQTFLRELLSGLINQIIYLSYLWMLWDDNKQTLADKVVHSTVIRVPKS